MIELFKVTDTEGRAIHGGSFTYSLPIGDAPGDWAPTITPVELCARGYHVTEKPMDWAKQGMRVWEIEVRGLSDEIDDDMHKRVAESIRLTRERPDLIPDWWRSVEDFLATIGEVPWLDPQGEPDPAWQVFDSWSAAESAARSAARSAAWSAARSAAWSAAESAAWSAARSAAESAAWSAARSAAESAAWSAARSAAESASLMARVLVCDGTDLDPKHRVTAEQQWDVWRRGYGLAGEVDGVLYVYRKVVE